VLAAPAVPCARDGGRGAHEHTGTAGALRHPLRNGFTAYAALSPETNSFCLRHRRIDGIGKPGRVRNASADLTPATGARTTRFCRTLQRRSSAAPPIAHGPRPALRSFSAAGAAASTAFRPTSVTIAIRPSWRAGTGGVVGLIWGWREGVYFCREGWTGQITLIGLEKLAQSRIALQNSLAPDRNPPQIRFRSAQLHFPTRWTVLAYPEFSLVCGSQGVSQFSCMLLLVAALMLTACFGVAAWRVSGDASDVTGSTSPASTHLR
jgi:hypothetical protein